MAHGAEAAKRWGAMNTPSFCRGGDFGSPETPKTLQQVNAHRRFRQTPGCMEPPLIRAADGAWIQAGEGSKVEGQVEPAVERMEQSEEESRVPVSERPFETQTEKVNPQTARSAPLPTGAAPGFGAMAIPPAREYEAPPPVQAPAQKVMVWAQTQAYIDWYRRERGWDGDFSDLVNRFIIFGMNVKYGAHLQMRVEVDVEELEEVAI